MTLSFLLLSSIALPAATNHHLGEVHVARHNRTPPPVNEMAQLQQVHSKAWALFFMVVATTETGRWFVAGILK